MTVRKCEVLGSSGDCFVKSSIRVGVLTLSFVPHHILDNKGCTVHVIRPPGRIVLSSAAAVKKTMKMAELALAAAAAVAATAKQSMLALGGRTNVGSPEGGGGNNDKGAAGRGYGGRRVAICPVSALAHAVTHSDATDLRAAVLQHNIHAVGRALDD